MKLVVFLLVAQSFLLVTSQCPRCERTCSCSGLNLTRVPAAPSQLISNLDLSFNRIKQILNPDFLTYATLRILIMKNNEIQTIQDDSLVTLIRLERLDLSHNNLETLSPRWLQNLCSLQYLNLLGNKYTSLGEGNLFQALKKLRILHVGGGSLQSVKRRDFSGLSDVSELFFNGKNLQEYEDGSLKETGPISHVTLDLSGVFVTHSQIVRAVLSDVAYPNTTLTFTDTTFLMTEHVDPFSVVANLGVTSIILRNVQMSLIALENTLSMLSQSNLTSFTFDGGQIFQSNSVSFVDFRNVHFPRLEAVLFKNIEVKSFYSFPVLKFLIPLIRTIQRVSLLNSMWYVIPCKTSSQFTKVQFLDMTGNIISDVALSEIMCYGSGNASALQTINISRNDLHSINSQLFTNLPKLQNIDMSGNRFEDMPEACHWPESLHFLNLSSSHLTKATRCLPQSLRVLDLSNNRLTEFHIELPFLTHLHISGNQIRMLPEGGLYPLLTLLSIQNNNLQEFSGKDLQAYRRLQKLKAGGNPYFCSCEFVAFMTSGPVNHQETVVAELESYVCNSPDAERGQAVGDVKLRVFECHAVVALTVLCSGFLAVCLLTAALCYRFSVVWYIRMTCAWLRAKRKPRLRKGPPQYDAFVSYSDMDSGWVEMHLVPELEQSDPPIRLCLHKRDFLPGGWILDNIMDAIDKSHRTLFILSRHFVRSEWCKYELDYSHFRLFDQNDDTVVLILLEPIDKKTIPEKFCRLRRALNSRTYLEWPGDDSQTDDFWKSLRAAIRGHETVHERF